MTCDPGRPAVRAADCLEEIRQAAAEMEADGTPVPGDDVLRDLAAVFRLQGTPRPRPPLQQPPDSDPPAVSGHPDAAARDGDRR